MLSEPKLKNISFTCKTGKSALNIQTLRESNSWGPWRDLVTQASWGAGVWDGRREPRGAINHKNKQSKNPKILQTNSLVHTRAQSVPGTSKPFPELRLPPLPSGAQGVPGKSWAMRDALGERSALSTGSGFELWARPYSFGGHFTFTSS